MPEPTRRWKDVHAEGSVNEMRAEIYARLMEAQERIAQALSKCQWPSGSPQLRPSFLPARGHDFSPLVAIKSPHQGFWVGSRQVRGLTPLPAVAWASR